MILSYSVELNDGTGFVAYVGDLADSLSLAPIATSLTSGVMYNVRYRARNVHGWSDYSPYEMIVANTIPSKPLNVRTLNVGNKLVVAWDQPTTTGGTNVPLTDYKFYARRKGVAEFFVVDYANCVENLPSIISTRSCSFSMETFTGAIVQLI